MKNLKKNIFSEKKGGVLIEFALALPMLVLVIYFFIDISVVDDLQYKSTRLCSIIEQLSRISPRTKIKKEDFLDFSKAAIITLTGMPLFSRQNIGLDIIWTCIQGTETGQRRVKWRVHTRMLGEYINPYILDDEAETQKWTRIYHTLNILNPNTLSNLTINTNQIAIIMEVFLSRSRDDNHSMFTYQMVNWPRVLGYAIDFFIPNSVTYTDKEPI